jgi:spore germination cell wall hydrolase CwlJ-like protein
MQMETNLAIRQRMRRRSAFTAILIAIVAAICLLVGADTSRHEVSPLQAIRLRLEAPLASKEDIAVLLNNTPMNIAPADAAAINAARPLDRTLFPSARPFALPVGAPTDSAALDCMTKAVYYEAANESDAGQRGVAQVVLNRVRNPIFPNSVCGVVFQGSERTTGCQFSFTCDGSLGRRPSLSSWMRARRVALAALSGWVEPSVGLATHYHANYVVPYWASSLDKVATIGAHIFYTMRGAPGRPAAFHAGYDPGAEQVPITGLTGDDLTDPLGANGTDALSGVEGATRPLNRTVVQEDALAPLAAPSRAPEAIGGSLRADETAGELVADKNVGVLHHEP